MSVVHKARGVHVSSGEGIVAHLPNLTAFATGDEAQLNELLVRLNALAEAPWHEVVRTLTAGIVESNYDAHPDIACVSISDDRVAALVFGDTILSVTTDGNEHTLNGRDSSTWIDVAIHGAVDQVRAGRQSDSIVVGVLRDGVIPAGGFLLDTTGPMPASGRWTESTAAPSASTPSRMAVPSPSSVPPPVPPDDATDDTTGADDSDDSQNQPTATSDLEDSSESGRLAGMFARLDARHREDNAGALDDIAHEQAEESSHEETRTDTEDPGFQTDDEASDVEAHDGQTSAVDAFAANGSEPHHLDDSDAQDTPSTPQPPAIPSTGTLAPSRPQLRGLLCPDGHLTNGADVHCRTCGLATDPNAETVMGNRPVLGQLTFDDGAVLAVDRPAAIGSDVPSGYEIDGEPATVVRLDDGLGGISAVQVEVRTVGWDVEIHDMNSENGTYTILHGERQTRTRLRAGQSVVLQDGMVIEVGGRNFTYAVGSKS